MPKIIIDKFIGLGESDRNLPTGQFYAGQDIDLYRDPGYLVPGFLKTDITITGQGEDIIDIIYDPIGNYAYLFTNGGKVYGILTTNEAILDLGGGTTKAATIANLSQGKGITAPSGADSGADRIYFFYNAGAGDIAKAVPNTTDWSGANLDVDWGSTTPTNFDALRSNLDRRDCLEWNSLIWFTNGNYIGKLDTVTNPETLTLQAFNLGGGWCADRLFKTDNFLGIFASKTLNTTGLTYPLSSREISECRLYLWDGTSTAAYKIVNLQGIIQVHACINRNGNIFAFVDGGTAGHYWAILQTNGSEYYLEKVRQLRHDISGTQTDLLSPMSNSAVELYRNNILLGTYNKGLVMGIGRNNPNESFQLSCPFSASIAANSRVTAIKQIKTDKIYVGYYDGTNYKFASFSTGYAAASWKNGYIDFGQKVRVNYIKYYFKSTGTAGVLVTNDSVTVGADVDYGTSKTIVDNAGNSTIAFATDGAITSKKFKTKIDCHAISPTLSSWVGGVRFAKIVIDYDFLGEDN